MYCLIAALLYYMYPQNASPYAKKAPAGAQSCHGEGLLTDQIEINYFLSEFS